MPHRRTLPGLEQGSARCQAVVLTAELLCLNTMYKTKQNSDFETKKSLMQNANFGLLCPEIIILIHYGRYCDEVDTLLIYRGLLTPCVRRLPVEN